MMAFLAASRRRGAAVVAVNGRLILTTARAASSIAATDPGALWRWAQADGRGGDDAGALVGARSEPVVEDGIVAGFLVDLDPAPDAVTSASEAAFRDVLPGESTPVRTARTQLGALVGGTANILLAGAPGTGKLVAARRLLDLDRRTIEEFDCADSITAGWLTALQESLRRPGGVVLAHLDEVDDSSIAGLASALAGADPNCRIVATTSTEDMTCPISRSFDARVTVPALADRPEDLPEIAASILARHPVRGHLPRLGADARRLLWSYQWPGNVAELELVLGNAARTAPTAVIDETCIRMPSIAHSSEGRRRTAVLAAERDALLEALERCDGNKLAAADLLGIARSTLYRKLRVLAIA